MTSKQNGFEKIAVVFSIFHDGVITEWKGDKDLLQLKIECQYLAELVHSSFEHFYVEIFGIERLIFNTWPRTPEVPEEYLLEWSEIFKGELELHSAEIEGVLVKIFCRQDDPSINYSGGILFLDAQDIKVYDQDHSETTTDHLASIARQYWKAFGEK